MAEPAAQGAPHAGLPAGQIDMRCDPVSTAIPHVSAGRVRTSAVTTPKRRPGLPNIPNVAVARVPGYEAVSYYGLFAPTGVPDRILSILRTAAAKVIADPEMTRRLEEQGIMNLGLGPEAFAEYVAKDRRRWGDVIRAAGITAG